MIGGATGRGFGAPGGPDPRIAGAKGHEGNRNGRSVRKEVAFLMKEGLKFESLTPEVLFAKMEDLAREGNLKRVLALKFLSSALFGGNIDALNSLIDNIEGKLPNTNVNAGLNLDDESNKRDGAEVRKSLLKGLVHESPTGDEEPTTT